MAKIDNFMQGKCLEMCPKEETQMREKQKLLHILETVPGTEKTKLPKASRKHMVKAFSRSAAGKNITAESLRPPTVLLKTVQYLLCDVIATKKIAWCKVYDFITDRLMAVRQDMVVQNISPAESITILAPIVRFHAYAAYKLCEENVANFDPVLNKNHLQECLKRLLCLYDNYNDFANLKINSVCNAYIIETRPEFEALYLIHNMGNEEALRRILTIPETCRTNVVKVAMKISLCFRYGNFVRTCGLIRDVPRLLAAVASLHLPEIRRRAFLIMSTAYHSKNLTFPTGVLKEILLYATEAELVQDCGYYGVKCENGCVYFTKQSFNSTKSTISPRRELFIDGESMELNILTIILGL